MSLVLLLISATDRVRVVSAGREVEREVVGFPPGALPYSAWFVGSDQCGVCHTEQYRQHQSHPMALTGRAVTLENFQLWFSDEHLKKPVAWPAGAAPRYRIDSDGVALETSGRSAPVGAVLGSGLRGFTPISAAPNRSIRELRLSFSSPHDTWIMTPGSERDPDPLGTPDSPEESRECLECHGTVLAFRDDVLDFEAASLGVQCERCHGPGSAHLEAVQRSLGEPHIFNPKALRADDQVRFCGQCHRQASDINPLDILTRQPSIARHAGASLMLSACFRRSPRETTITCLDCHDPHHVIELDADHLRAACLRCHRFPERDHRSQPVASTADCVLCHMPVEKKSLAGVGFTDHWIRRPGSPAPIDSFEREEYLEYLEGSYRATASTKVGPEKKAKIGVGLAEVLFARENYESAFKTLEDALSFSPSYAQRIRAAALLRQGGRFSEAVETLEGAIASAPAPSEAYYQLGELLQQQGMLDEAAYRYRQTLALDPHSAAAHNSLGSILGSQSNLEEAVAHFRRALDLKPEYPEAHGNLGLALQRLGRPDEAQREFESALAVKPDWPAVQNRLARILATHPEPDRRDPRKAIRLADSAAELTGYENPEILDTLAAAYASAGQFEKAVAVAEEAIRLSSDDALAEHIRGRLNLYKEKKPYVESPQD